MQHKQDRQSTEDDEKKRILDLTSYQFVPPELGIYDGELRYYAANIKWAKIIEGHVSWLASTASWPEAEDENYQAIQQILIFLQGIDMATKADIRDGMYEAFNRLALQMATGQYANIGLSTDADGVVTPTPEGGDAGLPVDDPTTEIDETNSSKAGGAIAVRRGINNLLALVNTLYGADAIADTTEADANFIISSQYKVDLTALAAAITAYWTDRAAAKVQVTTLDTFVLDSALYCKSVSKQTINTVIVNTVAFLLEARQNAIALVNSLTDEQITDWYNFGTGVPATNYFQYSCVPIAVLEFDFDYSISNTPSITPATAWKANHRMLIEVSGAFVDSDNPTIIKDAMYSLDNVSGVASWEPTSFNYANVENIPVDKVPYQASHVYSFTLDKLNQTNSGIISRDNGIFALPNTSGILSYKITDLGEYTP